MTTIDRNWVGGLSSGLDTQGLIDKMIEAESFQKYSLERKRNTVTYQKEMLQEVNLKLFELQNKATDLTFSRTFNSKKIDASNSRIVNAQATTGAEIGSYTVHVKQLATSTTVSSKGKLAAPLEQGYNLKSTDPVGGKSTTLNALGITAGDLDITITGGGSGTYNIATGATGTTKISDLISNINSSINAKPELKGKIKATYDEKNNQIKFNLLDSSMKMSVKDAGASTIMSSMFEADGQIDLDKDVPSIGSGLKTIRTGLETTIADLGITAGTFTIERDGTGIPEAFDLSGLPANTSMEDMIEYLNHEIDTKASLVNGGVPTGDPDDRLVEFRYDESSGKIELINTDSGDSANFTLTDGTSDIGAVIFGGAASSGTLDKGEKLSLETFPTGITNGSFTIDGVKITLDSGADDLKGVLSRITSMTDINATYDSATDLITLTRKDGSDTPIGLGSATDTSNFLDVTGLIAGKQASGAKVESNAALGKTLAQANTGDIATEFGVAAGTMRITVNGKATDISYDGTETLNQFLDKIGDIEGIDKAYYDASEDKVKIITSEKGADKTLKIEDVGAGTFAAALNLDPTEATGSNTGSSLSSARPISDVKTSTPLDKAGFANPVTQGNFTINGVNFLINSTTSMTLDSVIDAINSNEKVGVKAHYDPTNGKFVLTSTQTGNTAIALGDPADSSNFLSAMGLVGAKQDVGQNAIFSVDGIYGGADQVSQSNSVSNVVDGVTFDFYNTTDAAGEVINIEADTETARTAIDEFIEAYNEVTTLVYTKLTEERNWELDALSDKEMSSLGEADLSAYEGAYKVGLLAGDSTLRNVRSQMRITMAAIVPGVDKVFDSLSDLGITTGVVGSSYQDTQVGILKVTDEEKLNAALSENPQRVSDLFNKDDENSNYMGIARRLKTVLNEFTKSNGLLTSRVGRSGSETGNSEFDKQIRLINEQISDQADRLESREEALLKQFSALEKNMSEYQSQSQAFASQLAQLQG